MNVIYNASQSFRGFRTQDDFSYSLVETPTTTGSTSATVTIKDIDISRITGTLTSNDFIISVTDSLLIPGHTFINQAPTIASVNSLGQVTRIANGTASIDIKTPVGTRNYTRSMSNTGASTQDVFQTFRAGTLGKHITDAMLTLVSGKTASDTTKSLYSANNYNAVSPAVTRNSTCFTASLDLSCISVMNYHVVTLAQDWQHPGLLISPRHVIGAAHWPVGSPMVFMRPNGTFQSVNIVSQQSDVGVVGSDIQVTYLSAAVTGITPFQVLPSNWATYLPGVSSGVTLKLPVLTKTAHTASGILADQISINQLKLVQSNGIAQGIWPGLPALATDAWYSTIIGGDSGGPSFVLINNNPVLLCAYFSAPGGFPYGNHVAAINSAMNTLATAAGDATAYALTAPTLTSFTAF